MNIGRGITIALAVCWLWPQAWAQTQTTYSGANVTGQLSLTATVNALQKATADAQQTQVLAQTRTAARTWAAATRTAALPGALREVPKFPALLPPAAPKAASKAVTQAFSSAAVRTATIAPSAVTAVLNVIEAPGATGFDGLTHLDQRQANNGNQFSVEPPSPAVAVGDGYILEGVNNAIQVYDTAGRALLPTVLATNELFDVAPAIDRVSGVNGVYPTDMRVFYDSGTDRWFVLQRSQDNDIFGNPLNSSHLYMAVSQTADPTGTYNIYTADTTDYPANAGCPCLEDYLQIGADQYGFYISADEYNTSALTFVNATIWAISKASLQSGASSPTAYRFKLPDLTGYEFAVQPATTPPNASPFLAAGGLEYFASTTFVSSVGNQVAIWAMSNTSSLATPSPAPKLVQILVPTIAYAFPDVAVQPDGYRPYGASIGSFAPVPLIDGGDTRVLSLSYSGGRLYLTLATSALDGNGKSVVGGAYAIFSPTFRSNVLSASVLAATYLVVNGASFLRPAIAVNAQGQGAIAGTLVSPALYPSAAFVPVNGPFTVPSTIHVASAGTLPEDGFTGYITLPGVARWGDYSDAVVAADGSAWMAVEFIGSLPRTPFANWDTFVMQMQP